MSVYTKVCNLIKRGIVTLSGADSANFARCQVSYMGKVKNVEIVFPYGLAANLPKESLVLLFSVMGQEENMAGIGNLPGSRFKNLKEGEVVVGNPLTGAYVKFDEVGAVSVYGATTVNITAAGTVAIASDAVTVNCDSDVTVTATGDATLNCKSCTIDATDGVTLGTGGLAIARVGDAVAVDPATHIGTITAGSLKNVSN